MCVCVQGGGGCVWGPLSSSSKHSFSSTSLVLVTYIRLLETHPKNVVSMHECYTYSGKCFVMACKCFSVCSINGIKRSGVRAGGAGAQEAVFFRRRIFQVFRERHIYSQDGGYDKCVNPTLGYQHYLRDRDPRRGIAA